MKEAEHGFAIPEANIVFSLENGALVGSISSPDLPVTVKRSDAQLPKEPAPRPSDPVPKLSWTYKAMAPLWSSPVAAGKFVLAADAAWHLSKLRANDGREVWSFDADAPVYGSPTMDGDAVYLFDDHGTLSKLDFASGGQLWKVELGGGDVKKTYPGLTRTGIT